MPTELSATQQRGNAGLVDVLDRVLDKGLVVAGDIKVSLAEVELLTIRIRLMICSIDKAEAIELREQLRVLEQRVLALSRPAGRRKTRPAT